MKIAYIVFNVLILCIFIYVIYSHYRGKSKGPSSTIQKKPISSSTPKKGVQVDVLKEGQGKKAVAGKKVRVHYTAWLTNGTKVDSSYDKGEVFAFTMGRREVIPGWEAGMLGMLEGEQRKFTIAPEQAYGAKGKANVPPNATIIFEVELLKVI